jgi:hypothetical protein
MPSGAVEAFLQGNLRGQRQGGAPIAVPNAAQSAPNAAQKELLLAS